MFHLSGSKKEHWLTPFFIIVLVVIAYVVGQIPLAVVAVMKNVSLDSDQQLTQGLAEAVGHNFFLFLIMLPFVLVLVTLLLCIKFIYKQSILSVFTMRAKLDWYRFFFAFFLWFGVMSILLLVTHFVDGNLSWNFNASTFIPLLLISLLIVPLQTTAEEVFFRGFLAQAAGSIIKKGLLTAIFTGTLFGLVHGANPEVTALGNIAMLYYIFTGVFLGVLSILDDGLELSMGYHAANNIFACIIVTSEWQAFQTDALLMNRNPPSFGWESYLTLFALQPLLLLLFGKLYKWKNWKEKLF